MDTIGCGLEDSLGGDVGSFVVGATLLSHVSKDETNKNTLDNINNEVEMHTARRK
jgi:hypothetical protein